MIFRLDNFSEDPINPITGREYDHSWIVLMLTERYDCRVMCGSVNNCAYTIKINRRFNKDWKTDVGDFIGFHEANGKNVILVMTAEELKSANDAYLGHKYNEPYLRENETPILIHSTPMDSWDKIKRSGSLKSWNKLKAENAVAEETPIGSILGDPVDFRDYIMFGAGTTGEIVVNSKQQGKIVMDENAEYLTGARLYFDAKQMARDGLLLRDGFHLKVKDELPLSPYMIWSATWENIGLPDRVSTPKIFAEQADMLFKKRFIAFT